MSIRNWVGCALAAALFGIFGLYVHGGGEMNTAASLTFGGGLLFCGVLIDFDHFLQVLRIIRGKGE
jgi:hypothetical protein